MARMQWRGLLVLISWVFVGRASASNDHRVEIAPGVHMPLMNLGGVLEEHSDFGYWLKIGGRGLDTAWQYGAEVQRSVGHAIRDSDMLRSQVFLTTKVPCCTNVTQFGCAKWADMGGSAQEYARETAAGNLEQLGVDYVDLLLLHSACDSGLEDTVAAYTALEEALASGKARAIGVSNFDASLMDAFLSRVSVKPAVNQCGYSIGLNIGRMGRNRKTLRSDQALGITHSAFAPLGNTTGLNVLGNQDVLSVARAHKTTAAQVALRWLVQQGIPTVTASSSAGHLDGDLDVFTFTLSDEEMSLLGAIGYSSTIIYA